MLMPRRRKANPKTKKVVRKRIPQPTMNFEESSTGTAYIKINTEDNTYLSFGKTDDIKWVHLHYLDGHGYVSKMYPIALMSIPAPATKAIGTKNIARIRELIRKNLKDGVLSRKRLIKLGAIINKENEK